MLRLARGPDDQPIEIDLEVATEWLLGNDTGESRLNRQSVRLYDFADTSEASAAQRAHLLMHLSRTVDWPAYLPRLDDCPRADDGIDAFICDPGVQRAHDLFRTFKDHSGLGSGTVSKLLHLKWPAFYPIADSNFRSVYRRRAAKIHRDSDELEGAPHDDGNIRAYWLAFRSDLAGNHHELTTLPTRVEALTEGDVDALAHARRLALLEPLRLLDMLVWDAGA